MQSLRILLADDHQITLEGLRTVLESQEGWQVCGEARTGREAVEQAERLKPDVVVMDFSMPEMNGLEATRRIRERLPDTEVLFLTMHESGTLAEAAQAAGARGFVLKTEARSQLVAAVKKVAEHGRGYSKKVSDLMQGAGRTNDASPGLACAADPSLTLRECDIVRMIAGGKRTKEIAVTLDMSVKTAETHRIRIMHKLNFHSVAELVRYAIRTRLVDT